MEVDALTVGQSVLALTQNKDKDIWIMCVEKACQQEFCHSADDQQFFYDKGFGYAPKRCKDCRWANKQSMNEAAAKGGTRNRSPGGKLESGAAAAAKGR